MKITVNSKTTEVLSNLPLIDLLNEMELIPEKTLVSINNEVVSQDEFKNRSLEENDSVELFSFVGGG